MIVCHCRVVSDSALIDALRTGADSVDTVCRATGAGVTCGGCLPAVVRLIDLYRAGTALEPAAAWTETREEPTDETP